MTVYVGISVKRTKKPTTYSSSPVTTILFGGRCRNRHMTKVLTFGASTADSTKKQCYGYGPQNCVARKSNLAGADIPISGSSALRNDSGRSLRNGFVRASLTSTE